jgi:hypothetical protein
LLLLIFHSIFAGFSHAANLSDFKTQLQNNKPYMHSRRKIGFLMLIIIGVVIGFAIKNVKIGLIIGLILGLFAGSLGSKTKE